MLTKSFMIAVLGFNPASFAIPGHLASPVDKPIIHMHDSHEAHSEDEAEVRQNLETGAYEIKDVSGQWVPARVLSDEETAGILQSAVAIDGEAKVFKAQCWGGGGCGGGCGAWAAGPVLVTPCGGGCGWGGGCADVGWRDAACGVCGGVGCGACVPGWQPGWGGPGWGPGWGWRGGGVVVRRGGGAWVGGGHRNWGGYGYRGRRW